MKDFHVLATDDGVATDLKGNSSIGRKPISAFRTLVLGRFAPFGGESAAFSHGGAEGRYMLKYEELSAFANAAVYEMREKRGWIRSCWKHLPVTEATAETCESSG